MSKLKFLFVALLTALTVSAKAQVTTDSKGFAFQVYIGSYQEGGETKTFDVNDIYSVSITDGFLVHQVLDGDGLVTDAQFYRLSNVKAEDLEGMPTWTFDATSGISGNVYKYEVTFIETVVSANRTQPSGNVETFIGIGVPLKTYAR